MIAKKCAYADIAYTPKDLYRLKKAGKLRYTVIFQFP